MPRALRRLLYLMLPMLAMAAGAADHDQVMMPLAPGSYPVACSNLAHDETAMARIGGPAEDFWEGNPMNGQGRYIAQILAEPQAAIHFDLQVPADGTLYPQFGGSALPIVTLVCYPTAADNSRPDYSSPGGGSIPRMERPGNLPIFPDAGTAYPLIVYSHSLGSSPLADTHLGAIQRLASYGYVVMAVFHADARVAPIRIADLGDLAYLLRNFDHVVEMQALRPLALKSALDDLLARPGYRERIDANRIGAFGTSLGGEAALLSMGAWLTTNLQLESRPVVQDPRIRAAVGYVPYAGQRLLPAFGDDQHGAQHVTRPFLAIGGTADTTAPLFMLEQAMNLMPSSHYLVALIDVSHQYLPEYADDVFGWTIPFLDAYVRDDPQALARFARTQAILGGLDDSLRINYTLPETGLWAVDAEVDGSPGRGFQVDARSGTLVLTFYGYEPEGAGRFWLAAGAYGSGSFSGTLTAYDGGSAFGGAYQAAHAAGGAGPVALSFLSATKGTITLPSESPKAISRFVFGSGGSGNAITPLPGLWAISSEVNGSPGRGFQIDLQGSTLVLTFFGYDAVGKGRFWLASGAYADNRFSGPLTAYEGGTSFGGSFQAAHATASAGNVTISFSSETSGTITLPGEGPKAISRFAF
jgi:dienelactone hydrolase